jgi:hypothetical protein
MDENMSIVYTHKFVHSVLGVKQLEHEAFHTSPSSVEVTNVQCHPVCGA